MNFIKNIQALFFILFCLANQNVQAQSQSLLKPKFGLKAGVVFATMFGPSEEGVDEQNKITVRVVAGGNVKLPLHERYGFNIEVNYIQKGAYYTATADNSFLKLPEYGTEQAHIYGYNQVGNDYVKRTDKNYKRKVGMNIINGYIELPVMFYYEAIDNRLQFDLGASIGFLISSESLGTIKFGEASVLDANEPDISQFIEMDLDFKNIKDEIGGTYDGTAKSAKIDGTTRYYPRGPSAYYLTDVKEKNGQHVFNLLDIGLQAGVSYYFTQGLRAGLRFSYSFNDVTTDKYDYSKKSLNSDGSYIIRNDYDANFNFQLFIGLQF